MFDNFIIPILLLSAVLFIIQAVSSVIGANIYDVQTQKRKRNSLNKKYYKRPLVTILINTRNSEKVIENALNSIIKSSYKKYEIIIIDNNSKDSTKKIVGSFIKANTKQSIRLVVKRKRSISNPDKYRVFKSYGKGDLVLLLRPEVIVEKTTIKEFVDRINRDGTIQALSPRFISKTNYTLTSLFQSYLNSVELRSNKSKNLVGINFSQDAVILKRDIFNTTFNTKNKTVNPKVIFDDSIILYAPAINTFGGLLLNKSKIKLEKLKFYVSKSILWPILIIEIITSIFVPILIGYLIYLAISLHEPTLLLLSWGLLTVFLILAVWSDSHRSFHTKINYTLGIPITFILFYLESIAGLIATLSPFLWPEFMYPSSLRPNNGNART